MDLHHQLIEHSIDAAVIIDERSTIIYANAALVALSGRTEAELTGAALDCLLPLPIIAEHGARVIDYCQRGGGSSVLGKVREMTLRHASGELIPIELKAVDLGVHSGLRHFGAFLVDIRERKALEAQLKRQALTDSLTGLPNRRAFDQEILRALAHTKRSQEPATVAVLDLDRFKLVNDRFGHAVGDEVLRMIARIAPAVLRAGDYVARVGGEEFAMLFPGTPVAQAIPIAERLREAIFANNEVQEEGERVAITGSIGLSALDPAHSIEVSWRRADMALYRAKRMGRNRVAVY
jgi:diguanylate cyclase (GGDEF)-like protein/PAS domain S-box-containing protein